MQQIIDTCAQLFKKVVQVNRQSDFGVDFISNPQLDGVEIIIHPSKEIGVSHLLWETIYFDEYNAQEKLDIIEDALNGIISHGIFAIPAVEQD